jgi:hypothetical protein
VMHIIAADQVINERAPVSELRGRGAEAPR